MDFVETPVDGAFVIRPHAHVDDRGFFARVWSRAAFTSRGLNADFIECNNSFSNRWGTLRGLHYQAAPHEEAKLVRCVRGIVFDVLVDVRAGSRTFGQWAGTELTADDRTMLYVPEGCAHGYLTLTDDSEVVYWVTAAYAPAAERGVRWDDPRFAIPWPITDSLVISDKDRQWPDFGAGEIRAGDLGPGVRS